MADIIVTVTKGRADPSDVTIADLYSAKNYSQALSNINRRLKKTKNDRLQVNKAIVLLAGGDEEPRKDAFKILEEIAGHNTSSSDTDVLLALDQCSLVPGSPASLRERVLSLWDKTLKAPTFSEEDASDLYETKLLSNDYMLAQKITQTRMKSGRGWRLRYIIATHLASYSERSLAPNKALLSQLAVRFLESDVKKATSDSATTKSLTKAIPSSNSPADTLSGLEELKLCTTIFKRHGQKSNAAELYQKVLDEHPAGLSEIRLWKELFDLSESIDEKSYLWRRAHYILLRRDPTRKTEEISDPKVPSDTSDWGFWRGVVTVVFDLDSEEIDKNFQQHVDHYSQDKLCNRSAVLAQIHLESLKSQSNRSTNPQQLVDLCTEYFKSQCSNFMCFTDLKLAQLKDRELDRFLDQVCQHTRAVAKDGLETLASRKKWIQMEINTLQQDYHRKILKAKTLSSAEVLNSFVEVCLRLYQLSLKIYDGIDPTLEKSDAGPGERQAGDDAAILAAMALMHLSHLGCAASSQRAIVVLEQLLARSPHNYHARILAVRIHLLFANSKRAIQLFNQLDVKNMQSLSVAWVIITRLSSLSPFEQDAQKLLEKVVATTKKICGQYKSLARQFLSESTWGSLLNFIEDYEGLEHSIGACIAYSELSTCNLLTQREAVYKPQRYPPTKQHVIDVRDVPAILGYSSEADRNPLEDCLQMGPLPQEQWAVFKLQSQDLRNLLTARLRGDTSPFQSHVWRKDLCDSIDELTLSPSATSDMTLPEIRLKRMYYCVNVLCQIMIADMPSGTQLISGMKSAGALLEKLTTALIMALEWLSLHIVQAERLAWSHFHELFTCFEGVQLVLCVLRFFQLQQARTKVPVGDSPTWLQEHVAQFKDKFQEQLEDIYVSVCQWGTIEGSAAVVDADVGFLTKPTGNVPGEDAVVALLADRDDTPQGTSIRELAMERSQGIKRAVMGAITALAVFRTEVQRL